MAGSDLLGYLRADGPRDDTTSPPAGTTNDSTDGLTGHPYARESAIVQQCKQLFYRAREYRRPLIQQWFRNYAVVRNRTWNGLSRPDWMPTPEVPEIYPILTSLVGWMTDTQPTLDAMPAADPFSDSVQFYAELAQDLTTTLHANWQIEAEDRECEVAVWDALMYGVGIYKTYWDGRLHNGLGNAIFKRVDPFTFYPDPKARGIDDGNYYIEARTMSLQDIEARWPGSWEKLGTSGYMEQSDEAPTLLTVNASTPQTPMSNPVSVNGVSAPGFGLPGQTDRENAAQVDDPGVTVLECWLRVPQPLSKGGVKLPDAADASNNYMGRGHVTTFDTWRCVIIGGPCLLADYMVDDLWATNAHPYDRFVMHDTGEFYGYSMCEMLTPSQLSINRLLASIEQNIWLVGNPVFKEDARMVRTKIVNKPGVRVQVNPGGTAEWLAPPTLSPLMPDLIRFYIEEMERISGLMAMARGSSPGGRNAQDVLNTIQEAGFVRVRLGQRNLERTLSSVGEKLAALICEFYDAPRFVATVGSSGDRTAIALRNKHFYIPTAQGRVPMRFQLLIRAGSSLPTSRIARSNEADVLFGMQAIDREAVLEAHQWPNRWAIQARMAAAETSQGAVPGQPWTLQDATSRQATRPTSPVQ